MEYGEDRQSTPLSAQMPRVLSVERGRLVLGGQNDAEAIQQ
jgi:hypothetical protein